MALYRIETKSIDLVVTFNVPLKTNNGDAVGEEGVMLAKDDFMVLVQSLKIVDYGLFA
jgi:hypothetical protein